MISDDEIRVLMEVQKLPLTSRPFAEIGKRLGKDEDEIIAICKDLQNRGIIRSFGPSLSHRKLGFSANPMTALKVPEEKLDEVGQTIANEHEVTHCYARSGWEYNLFFMIHGKDKNEVLKRIEEIVQKVNILEYRSLFSIRELKKIPFELHENYGNEDSEIINTDSLEVGK